MADNPSHIILFDGVCNLCSSSVQWIIAHDPKAVFTFASLQSETGKTLLTQHKIPSTADSVILIENDKAYLKSTAALRIAAKCSGAWKFLVVFLIVPAFLRNFIYDIVAKNRYKWFGKKNECWLPTPELKMRFLK